MWGKVLGPTWVHEVSHLNEQGHGFVLFGFVCFVGFVCREGGAGKPVGGAGELAGGVGELAGGGQDQSEAVLPLSWPATKVITNEFLCRESTKSHIRM